MSATAADCGGPVPEAEGVTMSEFEDNMDLKCWKSIEAAYA